MHRKRDGSKQKGRRLPPPPFFFVLATGSGLAGEPRQVELRQLLARTAALDGIERRLRFGLLPGLGQREAEAGVGRRGIDAALLQRQAIELGRLGVVAVAEIGIARAQRELAVGALLGVDLEARQRGLVARDLWVDDRLQLLGVGH